MPQFFADKPTERLIGPGIFAEHLNDEVLGRALDTLYEHDVTTLFTVISAQACQRRGLAGSTVHLDSTSCHVEGDYDREEAIGVVTLTKGYRRDQRPDVNQGMLNLIVENRAGLPLWMQPLSGNSNDTASFGRLIEAHLDQLHTTPQVDYGVAVSSALQRDQSAVPLSPSGALDHPRAGDRQARPAVRCRGGRARAVAAWLPLPLRRSRLRWGAPALADHITSVHALQRAVPSVARQLCTTSAQELKAFRCLSRQRFACEADARQALIDFQATLPVLQRAEAEVQYIEQGRQPGWSVLALPTSTAEVGWSWLWRRATFILATHARDDQRLRDVEVLQTYKQQSQAERGFRFLKDPRFQAPTVFLKSPQRIMALLMVMTVCLLVYAALEYRLRQALVEADTTVPDQKGKPTQHPTLRWVVQLFGGIHVLLIEGQATVVLNLKPPQWQVIQLLGPPHQALYT